MLVHHIFEVIAFHCANVRGIFSYNNTERTGTTNQMNQDKISNWCGPSS